MVPLGWRDGGDRVSDLPDRDAAKKRGAEGARRLDREQKATRLRIYEAEAAA